MLDSNGMSEWYQYVVMKFATVGTRSVKHRDSSEFTVKQCAPTEAASAENKQSCIIKAREENDEESRTSRRQPKHGEVETVTNNGHCNGLFCISDIQQGKWLKPRTKTQHVIRPFFVDSYCKTNGKSFSYLRKDWRRFGPADNTRLKT